MGWVVTVKVVEGGVNVERVEHPEPEVSYETLREAVGGYIERVSVMTPEFPQEDAPPPTVIDLWVNEEGLLRGLPENPLVTALAQACGWPGDLLVGDCIITSGVSEDGETRPLDDLQMAVVFSFFSTMQRLMMFEAIMSIAVDEEPAGMSDVEADADTLASAGYGTDEDYGMYESGDVP
jgi:hypothetical protein